MIYNTVVRHADREESSFHRYGCKCGRILTKYGRDLRFVDIADDERNPSHSRARKQAFVLTRGESENTSASRMVVSKEATLGDGSPPFERQASMHPQVQ